MLSRTVYDNGTMARHLRLRYCLAMPTPDNVTLCVHCRSLLLRPAPWKPHKFMGLTDVRAPEAYGDHIERRYSFRVFLFGDDTLIPPEFRLERIKARLAGEEIAPTISPERIFAETDRLLERVRRIADRRPFEQLRDDRPQLREQHREEHDGALLGEHAGAEDQGAEEEPPELPLVVHQQQGAATGGGRGVDRSALNRTRLEPGTYFPSFSP